jgi:hypothetical protein
MKRLLATAALALSLTTAAHATVYTVPNDVSAGHMNMRNGPGVNHSLVGAIPAGATVNGSRCVPRDDGVRGADWCLVSFNGMTGWVSQAGLMPLQVPPGTELQQYEGEEEQEFSNNPPVRRGPTMPVVEGYLVCKPTLDRSDRDPVVKIYVSYAYDRTQRRMLSMSVNHELFSGVSVDRLQQYADYRMKFDGSIYGWTGTWSRDHQISMAGGVYVGTDGRWYYREKQWKSGMPSWDHASPCELIEH